MEEDKKKSGVGSTILLIILVLVLMAECGFVFYSKVLSSPNKCDTTPREKVNVPDAPKKTELKNDTVTSNYDKYRSDAFHLRCRTADSSGSWQSVSKLKAGDKLTCELDFETYADDKVEYFDFQLNYSDDIKLVKVDLEQKDIDGRKAYYNSLGEATSVGDGVALLEFEVSNNIEEDELFIQLYDIVFKTSDNTYYTGQVIEKFEV